MQPKPLVAAGGLTTKIQTVVDAFGNPLRIHLTPGQWADSPQASLLIEGIDIQAVIADKAYDTNAIIETLIAKGLRWLFLRKSTYLTSDLTMKTFTLIATKSNVFSTTSTATTGWPPAMIRQPHHSWLSFNWPQLRFCYANYQHAPVSGQRITLRKNTQYFDYQFFIKKLEANSGAENIF